MNDMPLRFTKIRDVKSPCRGNEHDAGIDLFVPSDFKEKNLRAGDDILIPMGIRVIVPKGYAGIILDKSSVCVKKNLKIGAKVVDCGYEGELLVHVFNLGKEAQVITPDMKITQMVLIPVLVSDVLEISEEQYEISAGLTRTERGTGALGSTGS